MKRIILAAISAGILSGCSSAPPLATPKGEFVDMNTDITSLLPHSEPVYTGAKIANVTNPSLITIGAKTGSKDVPVSRKNDVVNSGGVLTTKSKSKVVPDKPVQKATSVPLKGFDAPVVTIASNATSSNLPKTVLNVPASGRNPFSRSDSVKPLTSIASKPSIPVATVKIAPVMKVWKIEKGTTLKSGFTEWVSKETCPKGKGKWLLRWETDTDYPIDYPLSFSSKNFEDATSKLFNLYQKAQAPLYVSGYRNQCLIVISDKK